MKKSFIVTATIIGISVSALSGVYAMGHLPAPEGEALWNYISEENPYENWEFWPGYEGMYPGQSPHGAYLKLYANKAAMEAVRAGKPMPAGAILVKENYGKDKKTLKAVTPMYKVEGYNAEAGDWFWGKYGPKGKIMAAGKVGSCISCHRGADDQDYIITEAK